MNTNFRRSVAAAAVIITALPTMTAQARPPRPKISARQAEAAAIKKILGRAQSAKYEFEDGRWQYAVLVKTPQGQLYEVEVNATTGRVMDTEKTSAGEEAKEAAADKKAAARGASDNGERGGPPGR